MVKSLDRKLFRDLYRMLPQAVSISLIVACGIAVFVAALTCELSLSESLASYYRNFRFADLFTELKRAPESLTRKIEAVPGVASAESRLVYDVNLEVPGLNEPAVGRMISLSPDPATSLNRLFLRKGRWPDSARTDEALVEEHFATGRGLQPGDRLFAIINGRRETLTITGIAISPEEIFPVRGGTLLPDDPHFGVFWIGRPALEAAFGMKGAFNSLTIVLLPGASEKQVAGLVEPFLEPYGSTGVYGREDQLSHKFITQEINEQRFLATTVPVIFLGVAVFLLNVVLGRHLTSQREQIALLKAVGYANHQITFHYLKWALIVVSAGWVIGAVFGVWFGRAMTSLYAEYFKFPGSLFHFPTWPLALAGAISLSAAAVGSISGVLRILSLPAAEAMRPPSPPLFGASFIDRPLFRRRFGPQTRMILRHTLRKPLRFFLTVAGISMAAAVLVSGLFWQDAVRFMVMAQFEKAERGDGFLIFNDAVPRKVLHEVEKVPGVTYVETFRDVPVRIRAGYRTYRTAIRGIPEASLLRILLDEKLRSVRVSSGGLFLTDRLGALLGIKAGENVIVEELTGERRIREVPVMGLVNDMIGLSGYMELETLNRLVSGGDAVTSAAFTVDRGDKGPLYDRIRKMPRVAEVALKELMLRSFEEHTGKYILVFAGILTAFASVIAVGIVYNNARIALSERVFELAGLRILGFTRREVSILLLGELAAALLLAIPLGLGIGYLFAAGSLGMADTELFKVPLVIEWRTYAFAALAVLISGAISALIVRRGIDKIDLVATMKTRE